MKEFITIDEFKEQNEYAQHWCGISFKILYYGYFIDVSEGWLNSKISQGEQISTICYLIGRYENQKQSCFRDTCLKDLRYMLLDKCNDTIKRYCIR